MVNCILAACGQIGDMARALETFEQFGSFGLRADTSSYNAVLHCCVAHNFLESVPKVRSPVTEQACPRTVLRSTAWYVNTHGRCQPSVLGALVPAHNVLTAAGGRALQPAHTCSNRVQHACTG